MHTCSLIRALALIATVPALLACEDLSPKIAKPADHPLASFNLLTMGRRDLLGCAKRSIYRGGLSLRPALERLVDAAEAALAEQPVAVTDKEHLAPSGDPHDYVSLAAQWWPDPNQPDGLPYVRGDGSRNPEADDGDKYDGRRLKLLIRRVEALTLAYYFTGKAAFSEHAAAYVRTWFIDPATRMNPHLKYAESIPGVKTGSSSGIIQMRYLPRLLGGVGLIRASGHWSVDDQQAMVEWIAIYLEWLRNSPQGKYESSRQTNHGSWYDVQVAGLALFLMRPVFVRTIIAASATGRIAAQIEPDGRQPAALRRATSLFYSVFNLRALMQLAEMGRSVDVDLWRYEAPNGASIRTALDFLAPYADPASPWPWPGRANPTARNALLGPLRMGELVYADPTYADWIARIPEDARLDRRVQLLYPPSPVVGSCIR